MAFKTKQKYKRYIIQKYKDSFGNEFVSYKKNNERWAIIGKTIPKYRQLGKYTLITSFGLQPHPVETKKEAIKEVKKFIKENE